MRSDAFAVNKSVHIKLKKEIFAAFRVKLFEMDLSMQEIFNEFAKQVANEDVKAMSFVNRYCRRRLKQQVGDLRVPDKKLKFDPDMIYDLIHEPDEEIDEIDDDEDEEGDI
jgi:hypothetical protein